MRLERTKKLAIIAMLIALSYVIMVVGRIPVLTVPPFLKYDPKDVIITIGGFLFGPLSAFAISFIVSFLEMITVSDTGIVGALMNIVSTCAFACFAALIYKRIHSLKGAVIGLAVGWVAMTGVMILWNYIITPIYLASLSLGFSDLGALSEAARGMRPMVAGMLIPVFLPFNLLKGGMNAALSMLVYKPIRMGLDKSRLLPMPTDKARKKTQLNIGALLVSAFVLITGVLIILVYQGII